MPPLGPNQDPKSWRMARGLAIKARCRRQLEVTRYIAPARLTDAGENVRLGDMRDGEKRAVGNADGSLCALRLMSAPACLIAASAVTLVTMRPSSALGHFGHPWRFAGAAPPRLP